MPKISIVVPVHNSEKRLNKCLDSIFNQNFKDIEVICVDDNSTDNSCNILKDYQERYGIIIKSSTNKGAGNARNVGLNIANGEYLYFLDSDDCLANNSLEIMYSKITETNADILIFNYFEYNVSNNKTSNSKIKAPVQIKEKIFNRYDIPKNILCDFSNFVWNKLFKADFIKKNNIKFQEILRTNDVFFVRCSLILADRIFYLDNNLIYYSIGQTTNLQNNNYKLPKEFTKSILALKDFLTEQCLYKKYEYSYKQLAKDEINNALMSLKSHPAQYFELTQYLNETILKKLDLRKSDIKIWCNFKIFLVWLFSIRTYRATGYKILNVFGRQIWVKWGKNQNK